MQNVLALSNGNTNQAPFMLKNIIRRLFRRTGFDIVRYQPNPEPGKLRDMTDRENEIVQSVKPYTLTGEERIAALLNAVGYVTEHNIPGDIVECGVWRGGSMMAVALALLYRGDSSRHLYLYDTFEGMSEPTIHDHSFDGVSAQLQLEQDPSWCLSPIEDVRANVLSTGYPEEKVHFIRGKVEETLPCFLPNCLSLLRLDTDWYESTKHELIHLFPLLDPRGLLIVDDYGHWQGARKAVDEYLTERKLNLYLHRVDYTCRVAVRTGSISTENATTVTNGASPLKHHQSEFNP
jgi:O-methyltransferase